MSGNKEPKKVVIVGNNYGVANMFKSRKDLFTVLLDDKKTEPDLLVFTGGADINPKLYGEEALKETSYSQSRDAEDLEYWNLYPATPKVGICRGGQFLNVMSGGSMWQHVDQHGRDHLMHNLLQLPTITDKQLMVTSTHHQMMVAGPEGEVIAIATDHNDKKRGLSQVYKSYIGRKRPNYDTEVVWYPKTSSLCFQPHPEYNVFPEMREYFFKLVNHFFG